MKDGKKMYLAQVKTRDIGGKQILRTRQGIKTEREAERIEFELKKEVEAKVSGRAERDWVSWVSHCLNVMKLDKSPSTCINYEKNLGKWVNPIWTKRNLRDFTKSEVHKVIFELIPEGKVSPATRKTILKQVRRVFQMAVDDGLIDRNPAIGITVQVPESDKEVLTGEEVKQFLLQAKICDHRFYPVWVLALMTGMRSGELYALGWNDVDLTSRLIRVNKQWTNKAGITDTKTRRSRVVPISDELARFLKEWRLKVPPNADFVLPQLKEWENGEQAQVTREFCRAIGVREVKFHDLRATFITNLLSRGVPLAQVMAIVGHSQIKTTNVYLRKAGVDIKGATENLGYSAPPDDVGNVLKFAVSGNSNLSSGGA